MTAPTSWMPGRTLACAACMVTILGAASFPHAAGAGAGADGTSLELRQPIECQMGRAEEHQYTLALTQREYARVIVEQRGVDVIVEVRDPKGGVIADYDDDVRKHGQEQVDLVADAGGTYIVAIKAAPGTVASGSYAITLRFAPCRPRLGPIAASGTASSHERRSPGHRRPIRRREAAARARADRHRKPARARRRAGGGDRDAAGGCVSEDTGQRPIGIAVRPWDRHPGAHARRRPSRDSARTVSAGAAVPA